MKKKFTPYETEYIKNHYGKESSKKIAEKLGRNYKTVINKANNMGLVVSKRALEGDTICWDCKNACGDCSWSRFLMPVVGWEAIETEVDENKSYRVVNCPSFELEDKKKIEEKTDKKIKFNFVKEFNIAMRGVEDKDIRKAWYNRTNPGSLRQCKTVRVDDKFMLAMQKLGFGMQLVKLP